MSEVIVVLSSLNIVAAIVNAWLFKNHRSSVYSSLETQIVERAMRLYKGLRDEYDGVIKRLQDRIRCLERQEKENETLRKQIALLSEEITAARTREEKYKDAITRLDREVMALRKEAGEYRADCLALKKQVENISLEHQTAIARLQMGWETERRFLLEEIQTLRCGDS